MPSVIGTDDNKPPKGFGVKGTSTGGAGVIAQSETGVGVNARSTTGEAAVLGNAGPGYGVEGLSASGTGVVGSGPTGVTGAGINVGVFGDGKNGVHGHSVSPTDSGVWGENTGAGYGVSGSTNSGAAAGVWGDNSGAGPGVKGTSAGGDAVQGVSQSPGHAGVSGINTNEGTGIYGSSLSPGNAGKFDGNVRVQGILTVWGPPVAGQITIDPLATTIVLQGQGPGIDIYSTAFGPTPFSIGTTGISRAGGSIDIGFPNDFEITIDPAVGRGGGLVVIKSDLTVNGNAKFQGGKQGFLVDEFLNCSETVLERGDLLALRRTEAKERYGDRIPIPQVELAHEAYAVAVCGVVDGPALQSEHRCHDTICAEVPPGARGLMVTIGCYADCKVDADVVPIEVGDLLTTSSTPGHAQKVLDRSRAVGAIVGKALKGVEKGKATIPILVLLH